MQKPQLAAVKTIYKTNAGDIPGMLRSLADDIESGRYPNIDHAVCAIHDTDGRMNHYGWGRATPEQFLATAILMTRQIERVVNKGPISAIPRTPPTGDGNG